MTGNEATIAEFRTLNESMAEPSEGELASHAEVDSTEATGG